MNILLVGATSPIGQNLRLALSAQHKVFTAGRTEGDLIWDLRNISRPLSMKSIEVDVIINLTASYGGRLAEEIIDAEIVNVIGALRICDLAVKSNVKHLVLISSILSLLNEDSRYFGIYPLSKRHSEEIINLFCADKSLSVSILRPSQVYGDDDRFRKNQPFFYTIMDQVLRGEEIRIDGSNDPKRNYMHVDDLVTVITKVVEGRILGAYTCQHPTDVSYSEIANIAINLVNSKSHVKFNADKPDIADKVFGSDNELYSRIGFQPSVSIKEGLWRIIQNKKKTE